MNHKRWKCGICTGTILLVLLQSFFSPYVLNWSLETGNVYAEELDNTESVPTEDAQEEPTEDVLTEDAQEEPIEDVLTEDAQTDTTSFEDSEITEDLETVISEDVVETAAIELGLESPSVILMEPTTGQILYEKNADEQRHPASVTKVMTLLLTFEAIEQGKMTLSDTVTISEHAASMGGSQCFFEAGETQTVEDMIKCIIIASGNDAAVAMGEHIAGSEEGFVQMMNDKAAELGMTNTHFENACGLDAEGHLTTARDIAIMSRELTTKYPEIFNYSTIWMDTITHVTRRGSSEFGLSNTNKLLKTYPYCTGLKTGYTSEAGFSISATASKDGINLIAVVMGATTKEIRNSEVCKLFDYGFANCSLYQDEQVVPEQTMVSVLQGRQNTVSVVPEQDSFAYMLTSGQSADQMTKEYNYSEVTAPVTAGDVIGEAVYYYAGERVGAVALLAGEDVQELNFGFCYQKLILHLFCVTEKENEA